MKSGESAKDMHAATTPGSPGSTTPLLDLVRRLAFPRFPGTPAERRAADMVARAFADAGLEVSREPFEASTAAIRRIRMLLHGIAAALALLMGFAAPQTPEVAAFAAAALLVLVARAGTWPRALERWFDAPPLLTSENVVGRMRERPPPGSSTIRIVLLAHLDSKSSRFPTFVPVAALSAATLLVLAHGVHAALAAAGTVSVLSLGPSLAISAAVVAALAVSLSNPSGDESPGAMDNASGLAILIDAARTLPVAPAELLFLATGAEEIGLAGAMRWIQAHESELERRHTVFVNVDSVGVGRGLFALDVHGEAPDGRPMREVVKQASRAANVRVDLLPALPGVGVDTMPIAARGYATVTILGRVLGAASRRIHSRWDVPDALGEEGLQDAARVVESIVREIRGAVITAPLPAAAIEALDPSPA